MNKIFAVLLLVSMPIHAKPISDKQFKTVIMCESSNRDYVWGDDGVSFGVLQFTEDTFYRLAKKAWPSLIYKGAIEPHRRPWWKSRQQQLLVGRWAMDHGWGHEWTCGRKVLKVKRPKRTNFDPMD